MYYAHFSGPQPHHESAYEQYSSELLQKAAAVSAEFVIADRIWLEAEFYDNRRRGFIHEQRDHEALEVLEQHLRRTFGFIQVTLIRRPWNTAMVNSHLEEIHTKYPNASEWYINQLLKAAQKEHEEYYEEVYPLLSAAQSKGIIDELSCFHSS